MTNCLCDQLVINLVYMTRAGILAPELATKRLAYELFLRRKSKIVPDYRTLYTSAHQDWMESERLIALYSTI